MISATFDVPTEVRHITGKSFLVENARMSTKKRVMPRQVLHLWFSGVAVQKKGQESGAAFVHIFEAKCDDIGNF